MAGPQFAADPSSTFLIEELDGLTALYHRSSGMTHLLAPPAPQILAALADGAANADALLARIGGRFEVDRSADGLAAIEARLAELEAAGLAWRI